ncbi:MAG: protein kinase [Planctomycetaceae bacterium]|jgi:WD40 repeat protein/serine/threonine protein kinase|nr:protein kinase [Planctomycetaceae bacterium]
MFNAVCPFCFQRYTLDDSYIGKTACCRQCKRMFKLEEDDTATNLGPLIISEARSSDSGFEIKQSSPQLIAVNSDIKKQQVANPKIEKRFDPESGMWNIGDVVLGIYEVIPISGNEPFSEGGVGVVHRVYHREWDMELAVKSPKPHVFQTESGKLNYEKEAQTWIELGLHPNIVTCYLVRRISDIPRLFAEFVNDGSLKQWILDGRLYSDGKPAALLRILNIAIQSAWGLEHAHSQKLLHLDVKPANIMMSGQIAKVTDFGLAQGISEIAISESDADIKRRIPIAAGGMTPGFCSPEQYESFEKTKNHDFDNLPEITLQSDIWSWGISLFAMFHGRAPCRKGGQTARKVLEIFLREPVESERPLMPPQVAELLFNCFELDPSRRPATMGEVAEKLTAIYRELSGVAFPRSKPVSATWTPETINNRAASMLDLGKPAEAKQLLDQAAELQPWHPEVTYNQTILQWRAAQITDLQAVEKLEALVKARTQDANAIYALALAQRERGNLKTAIEETSKAMEIELREEYRRAFISMERILKRTARCVERIQITAGFEGNICVDSRGEFILVEKLLSDLGNSGNGNINVNVNSKFVEIIQSATGQVWHKFTPSDIKNGEWQVALSDDLLWELVKETGDNGQASVMLRRIGAKSSEAKFQLVEWSQNLSLSSSNVVTGKIYSGRINGDCASIVRNSDGVEVGVLIGHEGVITGLSFSADGRFAFTGGSDRTLRLWELPVTRCLRTFLSIGGAAMAVYLDKSGEFALSLESGGLVRIWDVSILCSGNLFHAPLLLSHVTSSEEAGRRQSEMNNYYDKIRESVQQLDYGGAISFISKAAKLSGWEMMRMKLDAEGILNNIERHSRKRSLSGVICSSIFEGHFDAISAVVISADGKVAASAGRDVVIRVWDILGRRCVNELSGHSDWVRSICMTRDGRFLVSGSWDGTVRVWNILTGKCVRITDEKIKSITKIAINPQGRTVAIATAHGKIIFWDVLTSSVSGSLVIGTGSINAIKFSCDGEYMIIGCEDGNVLLWRLQNGSPERILNVHKSPVTDVTIAPNLSRVISADKEGSLLVCDLATGCSENFIKGHLSETTGVIFLSDSKFFISCSRDGKVMVCSTGNNNSNSNNNSNNSNNIINGNIGNVNISNNNISNVNISNVNISNGNIGGMNLVLGEVEHLASVSSMSVDVSGGCVVTGSEDAVVRVWSLYWDYEFPGWSDVTPEAEKMIKIFLNLYKNNKNINEQNKQQINMTIVKRIITDMEHHGFGFVMPIKLKEKIIQTLEEK